MAQPVRFEHANDVLRATPEQAANGVGDLPIYRDQTQVCSCWELSAEEITEVIRTGRVYLFVQHSTHPPVCIMGSNPWQVPGDFTPAD